MAEIEQKNWHNLTTSEALASLQSGERGLSPEEAQRRLVQFGPNELQQKEKASPWQLLFEQFKNFLIIILLIAVALDVIVALTGEGESLWEPALILLIVILAVLLGFTQEYRAEKTMEALKQMAAPTASVIRGGEETTLPSRELVPGDIILLRTGDRIPADARLVEAVNLKVDEAPLTGESVPVDKKTEPLPGEMPVGDRKNIVYSGTTVVYGRGKGVVAGTGMTTEFGKIAGMLQEMEEKETPLQQSLDQVGKKMGMLLLAITAVVAALGVIRGHLGILEMFTWGVSLAVAAVPEALPAVVTISLAIGMHQMAKRHALIRKLTAVETLGCTTYICSDKTGTLTQDEMTVRKLWVDGNVLEVGGVGYEPRGEFQKDGNVISPGQVPSLSALLRTGALCNDSRLVSADGVWDIKGDPTEGALVVVAAKSGQNQEELNQGSPRIGEIPFSSERKRMTTIHKTPEGKVAFSKGAPEIILGSCSRIYENGHERELKGEDRERILEANKQMAGEALRVLGMAYKPLPEAGWSPEEAERDMVFVGLAGMIDPPREEVKRAIELCQQARIKSVMITGDHKLTATAVARELGLLQDGLVLTGAELESLSEEEMDKVVEKVEVYARVSPAHKMRIVKALQNKGHVVAMTGDGVNDAPALKKADIGIAMGITGTDVSKEAAHMVLTDDNFASIVAAVEGGRGIFNNIKKYLMYLLSANIGEILLMLVAVLAGMPLPLVAVQLLWVNLVTDGLPALALAFDPADPDIMKRPPRAPRESIFSRAVVRYIAGMGVWTGLASLGVFVWARQSGESELEAQSLTFVTLIMLEMFNALNCRSERHSLFRLGVFTNKFLLASIASSIFLSLVVIYVPFLQAPFHTYSLSALDWVIAILVSSTIFIVVEIAKFAGYRRERRIMPRASA